MAFPVSPTNGSTATVNGIVYLYSSTDNAWTRFSSPPGNLTVTSNLTSSGNLIASNLYVSALNWANGVSISLTGTYSNVNVDAYFGANIGSLLVNAAAQATSINTINANLGAYQIYANANIGTLFAGNLSTQANIGAFYTYANTKIGTNTNSNLVVVATTTSTSSTTGALVVRGGAGIAGNVISDGNITGSFGTFVSNLSIAPNSIQQDVLNLNNNSLYNVNTIRINDPGTSEGIAWEGGSGWYIYESPNDLSNSAGNLQIVRNGIRTFTVDTLGGINIPNTLSATSTTTGALTVGGGVGIVGNLWVGGNIYASNLISIASSTLSVQDPLLYLTASDPSPYNYDIGFFSHFVGGGPTSHYQHTGFARNVGDSTWTLFSNVFTEPGATINWSEANIIYDPIRVGTATISNTTTSTSTTTGALVVAGGAGIAGSINVGGNITVGNVISNSYYSSGGTSRFQLSDIGLVTIDVASQQYKFGASGIEASPGIFGGSYGGNKLSLNNETALISNRYDTVTIQTGTDGATQNTWTFGNSALTAPGRITASGNIVAASGTASTDTTTGALVVAGGAGISGALHIANTGDVSANIGTLFLGNTSTQANLGAYQTYANLTISDINANIGAFYTYANTKIGTNTDSNLVVESTTASTDFDTGALVVRGGAAISGSAYVNKLYTTTGLYWAGNGFVISTGGGGGGGTGIVYNAGTDPSSLSANPGDQWYNTDNDTLYEYISDGASAYWVDIQSPLFTSGLSTSLVGNLSITGNLSLGRALTTTGNITTVSNINVARNANIGGNILSSNITVNRNATIGSNLTVTGNTISGNVIVSGNIISGGAITNSGNITTTGNISANNVSVTNKISTGTITTGNLTVTGSVVGNLALTGNVTADDLTSTDLVSGNITTTNRLDSTGNVAFSGANVALGNVANIRIDGGNNGDFLQTYGNGAVSWQSLPLTSIQEFTATGGQTVFTIVGEYSVGTVLVFVNGIQMNSADYTATDGTTVVLSDARIAGDTVRIVSSVGASTLSSGLVLSVTNTKNFAVAMSIAMGM